MMARSTTRSNQRPDTLMQDRICQVDETSCNARPDHTFGSFASVGPRTDDFRSTPINRHRYLRRHVSKVPIADMYYALAANKSHRPGRPLSSCDPRSKNFKPAPATRSVTTRETRTSLD